MGREEVYKDVIPEGLEFMNGSVRLADTGANDFNYNDETKTLTVTESMEGITLALVGGGAIPTSLTAGQTIQIQATYVITAADVNAGNTITNEVTVKLGDLEKKGEDTITTEPENPHVTVTKVTTSTPANGTAYTLGETITYRITVLNDGGQDLTEGSSYA